MENHAEARLHLIITGRVQGVFYRATAQDVAAGLGLSGWVRNLPDGSVETVAEGPSETLEQFLDWCHQGPRAARVDHITVERSAASGEFEGFQVTY